MDVPRKLLRDFGIGLALVLTVFGAFAWSKGRPWLPWEAASAAALALALLAPGAYAPVYGVWMPVAHFFARINTLLLLGAIYYLVLAPYALLLRLCGMRFLEFGWKDADSYWKPVPPRDAAKTLKRQF